jgi:hypothetical protein
VRCNSSLFIAILIQLVVHLTVLNGNVQVAMQDRPLRKPVRKHLRDDIDIADA